MSDPERIAELEQRLESVRLQLAYDLSDLPKPESMEPIAARMWRANMNAYLTLIGSAPLRERP